MCLLRHDPAGVGFREANRCRYSRLRRLLPLCQPVPLRDLDSAENSRSSHYENIQKNGIDELSRVVREVIGKIEAALDPPRLQLHNSYSPL